MSDASKTVFISYSWDSDALRAEVKALAVWLRGQGVRVLADDMFGQRPPPEGWVAWMQQSIEDADAVLIVCTPRYKQLLAKRPNAADKGGLGATWEGAIISQELYNARLHNTKFFPILPELGDIAHVPTILQTFFCGHRFPSGNAAILEMINQDAVLTSASAHSHAQAPAHPPEPAPSYTQAHAPTQAYPQAPAPAPVQPASAPERYLDISRIDHLAPPQLLGRDAEMARLNQAWSGGCVATPARVIGIVALGGEGKTSLLATWAISLATQGWLGCDAVLAWSFYSQGSSDQNSSSADLFFNHALSHLGDAELAASGASIFTKAEKLLQTLRQQRVLLLLDGLEPLQYPPASPLAGQLKDKALLALLKGLAQGGNGGGNGKQPSLCVYTTRYSLVELKPYWRGGAVQEEVLLRLAAPAGVALLRALQVRGREAELTQAVEQVAGHALTLTLLGTYLHHAHGGNIAKRDQVSLLEANAAELNGHAFRVMDAYAAWLAQDGTNGPRTLALLSLLGLFDRPASRGCITALLQDRPIEGLTNALFDMESTPRGKKKRAVPLADAQFQSLCSKVAESGLLKVQFDTSGQWQSLDAHPLLREYFAAQLQKQHFTSWRAAHARLFDYLCTSTQDKAQPTLADLQPLYQAVAHGCLAGLYQKACVEVYRDRILRGAEFYSIHKLGAFGADLGAVACFFGAGWLKPAQQLSESDQSWLLHQAAFSLRALGRLQEALQPMQAGLDTAVAQQDWKSAANSANNLSELQCLRGQIGAAVAMAAQAVAHAEQGGDAFQRMFTRTTHADALHQAGERSMALNHMQQVELLQKEREPSNPLLYALQGFQYCDLLLTALACDPSGQNSTLCQEVASRAEQALAVAESQNWLLSIALDHLTLGRCALLAHTHPSQAWPQPAPLASAGQHLQLAATSMRQSGNTGHLPRALIARAEYYCANHQPTAALADLAEIWEIAESGPMPLFMADIHLTRVKLFATTTPYPWHSPQTDLQAARHLIEQCSYWRRKEELEALEQQLKNSNT